MLIDAGAAASQGFVLKRTSLMLRPCAIRVKWRCDVFQSHGRKKEDEIIVEMMILVMIIIYFYGDDSTSSRNPSGQVKALHSFEIRMLASERLGARKPDTRLRARVGILA